MNLHMQMTKKLEEMMGKAKDKFRVHGLKIQDLRNIDIVEVEFKEKKFVEINGNNGAGKSTLIDALFLAILGNKYMGKGFPAWRMIEKGKDKALMKVTLKSGERTVEIRRSITKITSEDGTVKAGGSLRVNDTEGKTLKQEHLDSLINEFTVDPVSFSREPAKKQIEIVKRLGGIDTTKIEEEKDQAFSDRTIVNRDLKALKTKVAQVPEKVEPVDVSELTKELTDIENHNEEQRELSVAYEDIEQDIQKMVDCVSVGNIEIERLKKLISGEEAGIKLALKKEENFRKTMEEMDALQEIKSTEAVKLKMSTAQETNTKAATYTQWEKDDKDMQTKQEEADKLTKDIDGFVEEKKKMILNSDLPFKNVEFDDSVGLVIGGIPFKQKSDAEKIRISTRIGMEMNPGLRILCIKDGSLLDEKSYTTIKEMADKHGYQVLVESVGERTGEDCIVMRSGRVVSLYEKNTTAKQEAERMEDEL